MEDKNIGFVLKTIKYGESSLIVDFYSFKKGRISYITSVSKSKKGKIKRMLFQPMTLLELEIKEYKKGLPRITEGRIFEHLTSIPYHPVKSSITLFLAEFLAASIKEYEQNTPLFQFIFTSLLWLDKASSGFANFHLVFLIQLSRFVGIYPNTESYQEGAFFDLIEASFTNSKPLSHGSYLKEHEAKQIKTLERLNYNTMHLFKMGREDRRRILEVIIDFYTIHIPGFPELKSVEVLKELFD